MLIKTSKKEKKTMKKFNLNIIASFYIKQYYLNLSLNCD